MCTILVANMLLAPAALAQQVQEAQLPAAEQPAAPAPQEGEALPGAQAPQLQPNEAVPTDEAAPVLSQEVVEEPVFMQPTAEDAAALPALPRETLPHDLSPWGMFMAADMVVKTVMVGLAFASLVTWTVWLAKTLELAGAKLRGGRGLRRIVEASTLAEAKASFEGRKGTLPLIVAVAAEEMRLSEGLLPHIDGAGLKERVTSHLMRIEAQAGRKMARGTGLLATIGSTAPFVGLFGTVWGIMNAFIGISEAQTTNLAVVAPGIAEALLATALGLIAAIPAVMIYNVFARSIASYRQLLADASAAVERLVSREIDYRRLSSGAIGKAAE